MVQWTTVHIFSKLFFLWGKRYIVGRSSISPMEICKKHKPFSIGNTTSIINLHLAHWWKPELRQFCVPPPCPCLLVVGIYFGQFLFPCSFLGVLFKFWWASLMMSRPQEKQAGWAISAPCWHPLGCPHSCLSLVLTQAGASWAGPSNQASPQKLGSFESSSLELFSKSGSHYD